MKNNLSKKALLLVTSLSLTGTPLIGASQALASEQNNEAPTETVSPEQVSQDMVAEQKKFEDFLAKKGITNFDDLTTGEQEAVFNEYVSILSKQRNPVSAILGAIAAAFAITKAWYSAGRYAANQCISRKIITRAAYKKNSKVYFAAIIAAFGIPAALGFDDVMYGR